MVWSLVSTGSICEWDVACERDVVEAEVPDRSVHHAICRECEDSTDDTASNNIIPIVVFVNGKSTADESCAENGCVDGDQFPKAWVVVGEDLELAVEVKRQEDKAGEGCSGVTRWHRLESIIDLLPVSCAVAGSVEQIEVAISICSTRCTITANWDGWLADSEEVRSETADQALDENLEYCGTYDGIQKAHDGIVEIPEAADTDCANEEDHDGDQHRHESGGPDWNDFVAKRVGELRIDDLTVLESDWERSRRSGWSHVDLGHEVSKMPEQ